MRPVLATIIERLGDSVAVSRAVQAFVVAAYMFIGGPYNAARIGGPLAFWLVAMLVCQVFVAASVGSLAPLQGRLRDVRLRVLFSLTLYTVWGTLTAVLMGAVGVVTGLAGDHIIAERLTVGVLFAVPIAVAAAIAVGTIGNHRALVATHEAELDRLRISLEAAEREVTATRAALQRSITRDLLPRLAALKSSVVAIGEGREVGELHETLAGDVRAMAHRLAEQSRPWRPPVRPAREGRRTVGLLLDAATVVRPVSPGLHTGFLVGLATLWSSGIVGPEKAVVMLVAIPWMLAVLTVGGAVMRWARSRSFIVRLLLADVVYLAAAPWGGLAGTTPQLTALFTWGILLVSMGLGWTLALGKAWDERRQVLLRDLEATVASLDHAVARTNQRLRFERERLARIVHGPVQDRLVAVGERLAAARPEGDAAIREASRLLDDAEALLERPRFTPIQLTSLLDSVATVWHGIATVSYTIDPRLTDALLADDAATETAAEIVREGVSNAIRHGRSRTVRVTVTPRCESAFVVEVVGDGAAWAERTQVGLGTRYLEATTLEWRLDRDAVEGSRLRAVIPWAAGSQVAARGFWRP